MIFLKYFGVMYFEGFSTSIAHQVQYLILSGLFTFGRLYCPLNIYWVRLNVWPKPVLKQGLRKFYAKLNNI